MTATRKPFLTADWRRLLLLQYDIDPTMLDEYLPPGCVADTRDGRAFVSLVAFDFLNTRVMGVRWPGYVNFPEVNLRAYVKHGERRGVVFIREFVPQRLIAFMANAIYNEAYRAVPMTSITTERDGRIDIVHRLRFPKSDREQSIAFSGSLTTLLPDDHSNEAFFKEHEWGFGKTRRGGLLTYRVVHPRWRVYADPSYSLDYDFTAAYGEKWTSLNTQSPHSVVFAEGSEVAVYPKTKLDGL